MYDIWCNQKEEKKGRKRTDAMIWFNLKSDRQPSNDGEPWDKCDGNVINVWFMWSFNKHLLLQQLSSEVEAWTSVQTENVHNWFLWLTFLVICFSLLWFSNSYHLELKLKKRHWIVQTTENNMVFWRIVFQATAVIPHCDWHSCSTTTRLFELFCTYVNHSLCSHEF